MTDPDSPANQRASPRTARLPRPPLGVELQDLWLWVGLLLVAAATTMLASQVPTEPAAAPPDAAGSGVGPPTSWLVDPQGQLTRVGWACILLTLPGALAAGWILLRGVRRSAQQHTALRWCDLITLGLAWAIVGQAGLVVGRVHLQEASAAVQVLVPASLIHLCMLLCILALGRIRYRLSPLTLLDRRPDLSRNLVLGLLSYGLLLPALLSAMLGVQLLEQAQGRTPGPQLVALVVRDALHEGGASAILAVGFVLLVAPAFEEVFFRGVLQRVMSRYLGPWIGVLGGATLFTLVHVQPGGLAYYLLLVFILGLVLGLVYEVSGQLRIALAIHCLHNALALLLLAWS